MEGTLKNGNISSLLPMAHYFPPPIKISGEIIKFWKKIANGSENFLRKKYRLLCNYIPNDPFFWICPPVHP